MSGVFSGYFNSDKGDERNILDPVLTGLGMRALDLSSLHAQKSSGSSLTKGRRKGRTECACAPLALEFMLQSLLTIS